MGRRTTNTTKGGKFMNPTDQARKEARRRELKKNKKQRIAVRQAVIKTKNPQHMIRELEELDDMELSAIKDPAYNEKVVTDKRRKLLESLIRIVDFYFKEDATKGRDYKGLLEAYKFGRLKKEKYYESVKNAEEVEINAIPLPDSMPMEPPLLGEIPLPGVMPSGILKKPPGPPVGLPPPTIQPKKQPPGPPPGLPPRHKVFIRSEKPSETTSYKEKSSHFDDKDAYDPEDGVDLIEKAGKPPNLDEDDDDEFHHRDDDLDPMDDDLPRRRSVRFADDGGEEESFDPKTLAPPSNVTPLQAMMLKLAGQTIPVPPSNEDNDAEENEFQNELNEMPRSFGRKAPPGPPPGMPPGPPPGMPPGIMNQRPNMIPPSGPPPPHMQQNRHPPTNMADQQMGMMQNPNILSAPPSLIHRPQHKETTPHVATIVAKPQLTSNPKEEATRFMPTSVRIRRQAQGKTTKQKTEPSASNQKHKVEKKKRATKAPADVAYDSFMKEMQGLL